MAQKRERLLTPVGTARYAWLKTPDCTFDQDGVFRAQLLVPALEAADLCKKLDELAEEAYATAQKENPGKKINLNLPYSHDVDDAGKPTGDIVFKFKTTSRWTRPNGEVVEKKLPAFDAKLNRIVDVPEVYTGSKLRISFVPSPYYVAAHRSAGVSLYINSYQILGLVTYESDAAYFGYKEEEGYVSTPPDAQGSPFTNEPQNDQANEDVPPS